MRDRATDTPCLPCLHPDAALEITRNDVLGRQLVDVEFKPGTRDCKVVAGTLHDPYTGTDIAFSTSNPSAIQIDHVISAALSRGLAIIAAQHVDDMSLTETVALVTRGAAETAAIAAVLSKCRRISGLLSADEPKARAT
ncbi:hypothetical protein [Rhodococcus qingshengii]|uniref:hypothetical protein n=1 Tax=Rhodococcus qingshengii TaxID=334542 RepID=UPI0030198A55